MLVTCVSYLSTEEQAEQNLKLNTLTTSSRLASLVKETSIFSEGGWQHPCRLASLVKAAGIFSEGGWYL